MAAKPSSKTTVHVDQTGTFIGETTVNKRKSLSAIRPNDRAADVAVKVHLKDRDAYHPSNVVEGVVELEVKGAPSTYFYGLRLEFVGEEVVKRVVGDAQVGGKGTDGVTLDALILAKPVIAKEVVPIFHENILLASPFSGEGPNAAEENMFKLPDSLSTMSVSTQNQIKLEMEEKRAKFASSKKVMGQTETEKYLNGVVSAGEAGNVCPLTGRLRGTLHRGRYYYPFALRLPDTLPPSVSVIQDDASIKESKARQLAQAERKANESKRLTIAEARARRENVSASSGSVAELRAQRQQDKHLSELEKMAAGRNDQASGITSILNPNKNDLVEIHYYVKAVYDGVPSHCSDAQLQAASQTEVKRKEVDAMRVRTAKASKKDRRRIRKLIREKKRLRHPLPTDEENDESSNEDMEGKPKKKKNSEGRGEKKKQDANDDEDGEDDDVSSECSEDSEALEAAEDAKKKKKEEESKKKEDDEPTTTASDEKKPANDGGSSDESLSDSDAAFKSEGELHEEETEANAVALAIGVNNKVISRLRQRILDRAVELKSAEMQLFDFRYQRSDSGISTSRRYFHVLSPLAPESQWADSTANKSRTKSKEFVLNACFGSNGSMRATTYFEKTLFAVDRERIHFQIGIDNAKGEAKIDKMHTSLVRKLTYRLDFDKVNQARIATACGRKKNSDDDEKDGDGDATAKVCEEETTDKKKKKASKKKAVRYEVVTYETDEVGPIKRKLDLDGGKQCVVNVDIEAPLQSTVPSFASALVKCSYTIVIDITASGEKHRLEQPVVLTHGLDATNTVPSLTMPPTTVTFIDPQSAAAPQLLNHHEAYIETFPFAPQSQALNAWKKRRNGSHAFTSRVNPNVQQTYRVPAFPVYAPALIKFSLPLHTEWRLPVYNMDHFEAEQVQVIVPKLRSKPVSYTKGKYKMVTRLKSAFAIKYPAPYFQSVPIMRLNGYFNVSLPRWTQCPFKFDNISVETLHRGDLFRDRIEADMEEQRRAQGEMPTTQKLLNAELSSRKEEKAVFYKQRKEKLLKAQVPKNTKYNPVSASEACKLGQSTGHGYGSTSFPDFIKKAYSSSSSSDKQPTK